MTLVEDFASWRRQPSSSVSGSGGSTNVRDEYVSKDPTADELDALLLIELFDLPGMEIIVPSGDREGETMTLAEWVAEEGITDLGLIQAMFTTTEWWQKTGGQFREFDTRWVQAAGVPGTTEGIGQRVGVASPGTLVLPENLTEAQMAELQPALRWIDQYPGLSEELTERQKLTVAFEVSRFGLLERPEEARQVLSRTWEQATGLTFGGAESLDQSGNLSAIETQIRNTAANWMIPLVPGAMQSFVDRVWNAANPAAEHALIEESFRQQAEAAFPSLTKLIERGTSPQQYFATHRSIAQELLERPIDFMGPDRSLFEKFAAVPDESSGEGRRPMTFSEAREYIKSTDEWQTTSGARREYSDMVQGIGRLFGRVA